MSVFSQIHQFATGIGKRLAALDARLTAVEKKTRAMDSYQTIYRTDTTGNITEIEYYRQDATLLARSSLSLAVQADGSYTKTRTMRHYALNGTTLLATEVYSVVESDQGTITETRVS